MDHMKILKYLLKGFKQGKAYDQLKLSLFAKGVTEADLEQAIRWVLEAKHEHDTQNTFELGTSPSIAFTEEIFPYLRGELQREPTGETELGSLSLHKIPITETRKPLEYAPKFDDDERYVDFDLIRTKRLVATLIDVAVVMALFSLVHELARRFGVASLSFYLLMIVMTYYFIHFDSSTDKGTPGKQLMGLKILTRLGSPPTSFHAIRRTMIPTGLAVSVYFVANRVGWNWAINDGVLVFALILVMGGVLAKYHPQRLTPFDLMSDTKVIDRRQVGLSGASITVLLMALASVAFYYGLDELLSH